MGFQVVYTANEPIAEDDPYLLASWPATLGTVQRGRRGSDKQPASGVGGCAQVSFWSACRIGRCLSTFQSLFRSSYPHTIDVEPFAPAHSPASLPEVTLPACFFRSRDQGSSLT